MKKTIRILFVIIAVLAVVGVALVQKIDRTPFRETAHYSTWQEQIAQTDFVQHEGVLQVGWAKENITPLSPSPMAGHGNRWGEPFEGVHDSLYVRVIAIRNASATLFLLSADMLIVPPNVTERLTALLADEGIAIADVHLGATHTHHGAGAWGQKLAGRLFGGKYDVEMEKWLTERFKDAILQAKRDLVDAEIYYSESENPENLWYRLKLDGGKMDPWVRALVFDRADGKRARMMTYAAHATVLEARWMHISRDYPGLLVDSLERRGDDFAMFMAGAMGSMGASSTGETAMERAENLAYNLINHLPDTNLLEMPPVLSSYYLEIPMPTPGARISINYALRPWVFKSLFGDHPTFVKVTKLGNTLLLGIPADFSGEIMHELHDYAKAKDLNLIVTSFSGGYVGYITPDRVYEENLYETVTMSWNGYQAGGYFTQVAKDIIDKVADQSL